MLTMRARVKELEAILQVAPYRNVESLKSLRKSTYVSKKASVQPAFENSQGIFNGL